MLYYLLPDMAVADQPTTKFRNPLSAPNIQWHFVWKYEPHS